MTTPTKIQVPSFAWISLFLFLGACYEKPDFPLAPSISVDENSLSKITEEDPNTLSMQDVITISINFRDGDGDLGLDEEDIVSPSLFQEFNQDGTFNENSRNYKLKVFFKQGENFVPFPLPDPILGFNGRFQRLNEVDKATPLEGVLNHEVIFRHNVIAPNTLLKFEVQIMDRALNLSNVTETDTIRVRVQ